RRPIEFSLLDFLPERWSVEVPLTRVTYLSSCVHASSELLHAKLVSLVGAKRADELVDTYPHHALDPAPGLDLAGLDQSLLGGMEQVYNDVTFSRIEGSNNWVVSGKKTASGKPILANDPHRAITNPGVRYITHLIAPGWNVIGAGEPASPGVSIGHNERIAFGLTIVGMDQEDIVVEALRSTPMRLIRDKMRVRGHAPGDHAFRDGELRYPALHAVELAYADQLRVSSSLLSRRATARGAAGQRRVYGARFRATAT